MSTDAVDQIKRVATQHLTDQVGWKKDEFRVEFRNYTADGRVAIVWGVHVDDERQPYGSPQKSLELHVDVSSLRVVKVLHFQ